MTKALQVKFTLRIEMNAIGEKHELTYVLESRQGLKLTYLYSGLTETCRRLTFPCPLFLSFHSLFHFLLSQDFICVINTYLQ